MSVHEDTLQGLREALDYVKGDTSKGHSTVVEIPDDDISAMYGQLSDNDKYFVRGMIERLIPKAQ